MAKRRRSRHAFKGRVSTTALNSKLDKNECFVSNKCILYLLRHFKRNFTLDRETIEFLCWVLGNEMEQIGEYLLNFIEYDQRSEIEEKFLECVTDHEEYTDVLIDILKRIGNHKISKFRRFVFVLLEQRKRNLGYKGASDIEKNIFHLKKMFRLTAQEIELCTLLFIISTYDDPATFFDYLCCTKFSGRKHLTNILGLSNSEINEVLNGTLHRFELLEIDKYDITLNDEFTCMFQNTSDRIFSKYFYSRKRQKTIPLNYHFIDQKHIEHILQLLKEKSKTSTHILLYGPQGTGKTSFADGLSKKLKLPTYEIARSTDNKSLNRRAAILSCLNMTTTGDGSIIIVDEADNILNTQFSWFMRGETQDKGWLNHILEEPGARVIWITNQIGNIDESVLRRFAYSIHFKPFNRRQRNQLWENILRKNRAKRFFKQSDIENFAKKYRVSAGVIDLAIKKAIETKPCSTKDFYRAVDLAIKAYIILANSGERPVNKNRIDKNYSLDGLNIKGNLTAMIGQLEKFDQFLRKSDQDKIMNMNLLFYGPPGTGKSELARYLAEHLDREVIFKRYSDLQSMWVGAGEKNIKLAFANAEAEEAVLVIDEADSFLSSRDMAIRSWEISFTNEFLTQMEKFRGILICTTNRFKDLDEASIRRFNHKMEFGYLNAEGNIIFYRKLLASLLKEPLKEANQNVLRKISNLTPGDFKLVRDRYSFCPSDELTHELLLQALKEEANIKNIHKGNKNIGF